MSSPQPCPACGVVPDRQALLRWGDGQQTLPVAPWICASCGALAMITLATGVLEPTTDDMWQVVRERNPVLWGEIQRVRAAIRAAGLAPLLTPLTRDMRTCFDGGLARGGEAPRA